ncbi:Neprosin domain-containing protein, partial [Dioscorea alata]
WAEYRAPRGEGHKYYGAKATLSVYGIPKVTVNQISAACIWITNGYDGPKKNWDVLTIGWIVKPPLYHDTHPHLFTYWTIDGYQTVCYDTRCPGFILSNKSNIVPGSPINKVSVYDGPQYNITIKVSKDSASGNWWLYYGPSGHYDELNAVGYWPSSLFTSLANDASWVQFGGVVVYNGDEQSPAMGSGHYPEEGEGKAAAFYGIQAVDKSGNPYDFEDNLEAMQDKKECYRVSGYSNKSFFYGGPAHCIK